MAEEKVGATFLGKFVAVVFILACIGAAGYFFKDTIFPSASTRSIRRGSLR